MRKMIVIAVREYRATVQTKAFIVSVVLMPIFMFGAIIVQRLLEGRVDTAEKKVVVLDETGGLFDALVEAAERRNREDIRDAKSNRLTEAPFSLIPGPAGPLTDELRLQLSDRVRRNEILGFVELPVDILHTPTAGGPPASATYYTETVAYREMPRWLDLTINRLVQTQRLQQAGIDPDVVARATMRIEVEGKGLLQRTSSGDIRPADKTDRGLAIFIPLIIMLLMFMAVMISAQGLLQSALEEKQQRIAEVLLGSVSPFQLMMGKLLGNVGVSMTMVGVYLVGGYVLARYYEIAHMIPSDIFAWFVVYMIMAVLLFGSIFIAIGSACTELKEAQNLMMPMWLILVLPMLVWFNVLREPLGTFATWLSLFPPVTPMLMILRLSASSAVPLWQPLLGVLLVLLTTVVCVFAAGRVFRIGILAQGRVPRFSELMRWVARG
jgi:ABC-2 type transport system permease protein